VAVIFQVEVFWVVMPGSVVVGHQSQAVWTVGILPQHYISSQLTRSRPEDGGSVDLRNVGILPQHYMASQSRRPRLVCKDCFTAQNSHR
jgi:hypothetical protein